MRSLIFVLVLIGLAAGAGGWYWQNSAKQPLEYKTAEVHRGELLSTIEATGTIEPEETVDVGAQVDGLIESFGKDADGKLIDYDSPVKANMVLAQIDDAVYKADFETAQAQVETADSNLRKGQADVDQAQAKRDQAQANWSRAQKLGPSDALSRSDYETYEADYKTAVANVAVADAEVDQAKAGIHQAQAALDKAQRNLDFCTIKSPVDGTIIDRRVNIGQTVVSSLSASSMFLIAKDLKRMQVWVAVNEADIGHIHSGQNVTFTTDALTGQIFHGKVNKVRLNAQMTQNVVTYTVEVDTDNSSMALMPYWTADVQFEIHRDPNVLQVPNAALRWYPDDASQVVPDARSKFKPVAEEDEEKPEQPAPPVDLAKRVSKSHERHGVVWIKDGQFARPVDVKLGPTDNVNTEVSAIPGETLAEGQQVIVGEVINDPQSGGDERDPFLPNLKRRK